MEYTNKLQNYVKDFHEVFEHPVATTPTEIERVRGINRCIWAVDEIVEFLHASSSNKHEFTTAFNALVSGLQRGFVKYSEVEFSEDKIERLTAQSDALIDAMYFLLGTGVEMGVDVEKIFEIVQASNMSKLFTDEDGNKYVMYREDGKVMKSPEFFPPETLIKEEILRQMNE